MPGDGGMAVEPLREFSGDSDFDVGSLLPHMVAPWQSSSSRLVLAAVLMARMASLPMSLAASLRRAGASRSLHPHAASAFAISLSRRAFSEAATGVEAAVVLSAIGSYRACDAPLPMAPPRGAVPSQGCGALEGQ